MMYTGRNELLAGAALTLENKVGPCNVSVNAKRPFERQCERQCERPDVTCYEQICMSCASGTKVGWSHPSILH